MNAIHLWEVDLNLLVVLDVLLREQSVTRAARRLGRTQSAISHALNRLRELLGDELLIRDGRRMRPTARGAVLADRLPRALELVGRTLALPEPFEAARSTRTFRLAAPDFVAAVLPPLLRAFAEQAPQASVELVATGPGLMRDLADGRLDAVIGPAASGAEGVRGAPLWTLDWAVFGRAGHPALADGSPEAWARAPHLQVRTGPTRGDGPVDQAAARLGLTRSVAAVVPGFAAAPAVLAQTDLLLTVPRLALAGAAEAFGLEQRPLPFTLEPLTLWLYRGAAQGEEPGTRWFLERVRAAAGPPGGGLLEGDQTAAACADAGADVDASHGVTADAGRSRGWRRL